MIDKILVCFYIVISWKFLFFVMVPSFESIINRMSGRNKNYLEILYTPIITIIVRLLALYFLINSLIKAVKMFELSALFL